MRSPLTRPRSARRSSTQVNTRSWTSSGSRARLRLSQEWSGTRRAAARSGSRKSRRRAVGAAPLQAALAVDAFEANFNKNKIAPRRQRGRTHHGGVIRLAQRLDEGVEPGIREHRWQPIVEHMPRRLRQLIEGHQHLALPWPLPPHRHGWHSLSLFYQQRIPRQSHFVNGLLASSTLVGELKWHPCRSWNRASRR